MFVSRWLSATTLALALAAGSLIPAKAQAQDSLARVIVDIADVVMRGNQPYYRYGNYGQQDRLVMGRDRYGRPVYYRVDAYGRTNNAYGGGYDRGYDSRYNSGYADPYGNRYGNSYGGYYGVSGPYYPSAYGQHRAPRGHHGRATISYGRGVDRHHRPQYTNGHHSSNRGHHDD